MNTLEERPRPEPSFTDILLELENPLAALPMREYAGTKSLSLNNFFNALFYFALRDYNFAKRLVRNWEEKYQEDFYSEPFATFWNNILMHWPDLYKGPFPDDINILSRTQCIESIRQQYPAAPDKIKYYEPNMRMPELEPKEVARLNTVLKFYDVIFIENSGFLPKDTANLLLLARNNFEAASYFVANYHDFNSRFGEHTMEDGILDNYWDCWHELVKAFPSLAKSLLTQINPEDTCFIEEVGYVSATFDAYQKQVQAAMLRAKNVKIARILPKKLEAWSTLLTKERHKINVQKIPYKPAKIITHGFDIPTHERSSTQEAHVKPDTQISSVHGIALRPKSK